MPSYYVEYWPKPPRTLLIGGVARGKSSRWGAMSDAHAYLRAVLDVHGDEAEGRVRSCPLPPEIFPHCPGHPSQVIGGYCFGCHKKLTYEDAKAFLEQSNERTSLSQNVRGPEHSTSDDSGQHQ